MSLSEKLRALAGNPNIAPGFQEILLLRAVEAEALERDVARYQEKADAIHRYLADGKTNAVMAVVTELSLDAEYRAALAKEQT